MTETREAIAVIGTGYVGLVTAAGFAELGNEVWCVDIDQAKIDGLKRGEIPIYEPGLAESVAASSGLLHFTTDLTPALEHARLLFVAVGTPPTYSGDADLSAVNAVVEAMPASEDRALVMKSTVPVGTRTDVASAEMVKLAANAFLATKISFINEIANVCEETGADVLEVAKGMGLDQRIGAHFLRPGIGYGGSCFPKDVSALKLLAGNTGYHFQLLTAVIEVNELQKRRVIAKLQKHLGSLVGKTVALLGLAFKAETDDMREASSLVLAARLQGSGSRVRAYDPIATQEAHKLMSGVALADSALEAVRGADAVVLVTEWPEFAKLDWNEVGEAMARRVLIDGRNFIDREAALAAGFAYEGVGR
jgi:UDPglucose 6-dehydrogenase